MSLKPQRQATVRPRAQLVYTGLNWFKLTDLVRPRRVSHQQHLDRQQVDENHPLVLLTGAMTVVEGIRQKFLSWKETEWDVKTRL